MSAEQLPPVVTSILGRRSLRAIVVGAGGTGGRLIPALTQVLRQGDSLAIVDGDHVEDRNLARQNFRLRDVGENKAEVMARRYRRDGIVTTAYGAMFTPDTAAEIMRSVRDQHDYFVLLGCVDNAKARQTMAEICRNYRCIWIDGGNEMRGGQVLMSIGNWPMRVKHKRLQDENFVHEGTYHLHGLKAAMPQLLIPAPWTCGTCDVENKGGEVCSKCKQPEASCADRVDLQTVAVNQLSATCMLNMLSGILYSIPFMSCGAFFSTLNTMSPIKLADVRWDEAVIRPETTYASGG